MKTRITIKKFKSICDEFDIGEYKSSKHFKEGVVQTNILLRTTKGRYVLRYYENRSENYIQFEVNLLKYLSDKKYPCAHPHKNNEGRLLGVYRTKHYALFDYIPGRHIKNPNINQLKDMIKYLAKLHLLSPGFNPKYNSARELHDKKYCLATIKESYNVLKSKKITDERFNYIKKELKKINFPNKIPKGIQHSDYAPTNMKFIGNKISGVLDFDDSCYSILIYDIAFIIDVFARKNKKIDFKKAKFLIKEYEKYRRLKLIEKKYLYDTLKMTMLTFLSWMFEDIKKGNDFDSTKKTLEELNEIGKEEFYKRLFK